VRTEAHQVCENIGGTWVKSHKRDGKVVHAYCRMSKIGKWKR